MPLRTAIAKALMYGGAFTALGAVFGELKTAVTWAEILTPPHVFGSLAALMMTIGAFFHPAPDSQ